MQNRAPVRAVANLINIYSARPKSSSTTSSSLEINIPQMINKKQQKPATEESDESESSENQSY